VIPDDVIPDDVIPDDVIPDDVIPDDVIPAKSREQIFLFGISFVDYQRDVWKTCEIQNKRYSLSQGVHDTRESIQRVRIVRQTSTGVFRS
jgi:hypothetical protein